MSKPFAAQRQTQVNRIHAACILITAMLAPVRAIAQSYETDDLEIQFIKAYDPNPIWTDRGSKANLDVSFWSPSPGPGWHRVGHHAKQGHGFPEEATMIVKAKTNGALVKPTDYAEIWNDAKSGADRDVSIYAPICPSGYKALGYVANGSHRPPSAEEVRCVRASLLAPALPGNFIWNDSNSGARSDFGAWGILPPVSDSRFSYLSRGLFYGAASHFPPDPSAVGVLWAIKMSVGPLAAVEIRVTDDFLPIWNDSGSGADQDVAFYRPIAEPGWFNVGDYAQGNHGDPIGDSYLIQVDSANEALLRPPVNYDLVWTDRGSDAHQDGSVWKPLAPPGYVCLGFVSSNSHGRPRIPDYRCVRKDKASRGKLGKMIWSDSGSSARSDVSIWMINNSRGGPTNTFAANNSHNAPTEAVYTLEGLLAEQAASRPAKPAENAEDKLRLLTVHAPRVWLAPGEEYYPSSVEWAFPYLTRNEIDEQYWLRTKQALESPSDHSLEVFKGHLASAPVYAFWVEKGMHVDLVYFFYYPYNRGKSVLDTIWGNHVGDWEHITVRLFWSYDSGSETWSRQPHRIYISAHNFGGVYRWRAVTKEKTHPVVYSAKGSHGCWKDPGKHVYKELPLDLGNLTDVCGEGMKWDTWERVEGFDFNAKKGLGKSRWPQWMDSDFSSPGSGGHPSDPANGPIYRWGNVKEGCFGEVISGECRLNNGPTGPISKGVWPNSFE